MRPSVPIIFDEPRRAARLRRAQANTNGATWLIDAMASDIVERIGFLRPAGKTALLCGMGAGTVAAGVEFEHVSLVSRLPLEVPLLGGPFDLIVSLGELDTINDLPGTLIHLRHALAPGGLLLAEMVGAGSLPALRAAMLAADGARPAARIHPQVDVHAASGLLARAGFERQVVDRFPLAVRYRALERLVADLRDQGLNSVLADRAPAIGKAGIQAASAAFAARADDDGRTSERFEIITMTAWQY